MSARLLGFVLLAGIGLLVVTGGAIGIVLIIEDSDGPSTSFFLAARIQTRMPGADGAMVEDVRVLRWWYSSEASRWRHEAEADPDLEPVKVVVGDGEHLWQYYPREAAYCVIEMRTRGKVLTIPDAMTPAFVGPSSAATLDQFISELAPPGSGIQVTVAGTDEYLKRDVTVLQYRPAAPPDSGWSDSIGTIRIDVERMFLMSHTIEEQTGQGRGLSSSVTSLDYGAPDEATVKFEPPAGARRFYPEGDNCDQGLHRE